MKLLQIVRILLLITLAVSVGFVGCGDEYDDDYDDDHDHDDDAVNPRDVVFDNPADAGRPSPSFKNDILPVLTNHVLSRDAMSLAIRTA